MAGGLVGHFVGTQASVLAGHVARGLEDQWVGRLAGICAGVGANGRLVCSPVG